MLTYALPFQCFRFLEKRIALVLATSKAAMLCRAQVIARVAPCSSLPCTSATDLPFAIHVTSSTNDILATSHLPSTIVVDLADAKNEEDGGDCQHLW